MKWTRERLRAACKRLLLSPRCSVELRALPDEYAHVEWESGRVLVRIDTPQEERVRFFIHEALHYVLRDVLGERFDKDIEEVLVAALEVAIYDDVIRQSGKSIAWWRRALENKLECR